jgi:multimeric flavodoxin WrbA
VKIVDVNGSSRKGGNTEVLIKEAFSVLESHEIEIKLISPADKKSSLVMLANIVEKMGEMSYSG